MTLSPDLHQLVEHEIAVAYDDGYRSGWQAGYAQATRELVAQAHAERAGCPPLPDPIAVVRWLVRTFPSDKAA